MNMKVNGTEILEADRIPEDLIIGQKYHCSWAKNGCVWQLKALNGKEAILETPKTRKEIRTHEAHLRLLNKDALKVAQQRIIEERGDYEQETCESNKCAWCDAIIINEDKDFCSAKCCEDSINER